MKESGKHRYLFRFGFETAEQRRANQRHGWDDENSQCLFIEAASEGEALKWGNHVAERFVQWLHGEPTFSWAKDGYASWIEPLAGNESNEGIQSVGVGNYPDFERWRRDNG